MRKLDQLLCTVFKVILLFFRICNFTFQKYQKIQLKFSNFIAFSTSKKIDGLHLSCTLPSITVQAIPHSILQMCDSVLSVSCLSFQVVKRLQIEVSPFVSSLSLAGKL